MHIISHVIYTEISLCIRDLEHPPFERRMFLSNTPQHQMIVCIIFIGCQTHLMRVWVLVVSTFFMTDNKIMWGRWNVTEVLTNRTTTSIA